MHSQNLHHYHYTLPFNSHLHLHEKKNKMILFLICLSLGVQVNQSPSAVLKKEGEEVKLFCTHEQTDYKVMIWYQKSPGDEALKFIGYGYGQFHDDGVEHSAERRSKYLGLYNETFSSVLFDIKRQCCANYEAYFGQGTKLTVLDRPVTPPKVKILQPSQQECRNQKEKQRKKTLVCVASGFYPDHVTVSWKINDEDYSSGVATDSAAQEIEGSYRITSRFKVNAALWENQENSFMCIVSFFDGETTTNHTATLHGVQGEYLKVTQSAKLSYVVVIVKSSCFCTVYPAYTHVVFYCLSMLYLFLCKSFTANFYPDKRYLPVSVYFGSLKA
uniref:Ig-like domain-containing protein n=1 Tax=Amphiprion ocellaris TaxID=80972 RepID=A0AAQ5ZAT8_AMPOC